MAKKREKRSRRAVFDRIELLRGQSVKVDGIPFELEDDTVLLGREGNLNLIDPGREVRKAAVQEVDRDKLVGAFQEAVRRKMNIDTGLTLVAEKTGILVDDLHEAYKAAAKKRLYPSRKKKGVEEFADFIIDELPIYVASLRGSWRTRQAMARRIAKARMRYAVVMKCKGGDKEGEKPWCIYIESGGKVLQRQPKYFPKHYRAEVDAKHGLKMMKTFGG